mgnify:CR=1 FL=1
MITVEQAMEVMLGHVRTTPGEEMDLLDAAGRVLGEDIRSPENLPSFARSGVDGYALRSEDAAVHGARLRVVAEYRAGDRPGPSLHAGEAVRIMTGAALPPGADAVAWQEDSERDGDWVLLSRPVSAGANVGPIGEDLKQGDSVVPAGALLRPAEVGLLAAVGHTRVRVHRRPRVAILSTGDEVVPPEVRPEPGQVRNSNEMALAAALRQMGAEPLRLGGRGDDPDAIAAALRRADDADLILTTGGASHGDYDVAAASFDRLGAERLFWHVAMKPGTPFLAACWDSRLVIGLSGNPAAAITTFDILVRPVVAALSGRRGWRPFRAQAVLDQPVVKPSALRRYMRGTRYDQEGVLRVRNDMTQRSGVLSSMTRANCYVVVPENTPALAAGDLVLTVSPDLAG